MQFFLFYFYRVRLVLKNFLTEEIIESLKNDLKQIEASDFYIKYYRNLVDNKFEIAKKELNKFIELSKEASLNNKKIAAYTICNTCREFETKENYLIKNNLIPHALGESLILPTLLESVKSVDYRPYYWIARYFIKDGYYYHCNFFSDGETTRSYLKKALEIAPNNEDVLSELINNYLDTIDYSCHHISQSVYLGEIDYDLDLIQRINELILKLSNEKLVTKFKNEVNYFQNLIADWNSFSSSENNDFVKFCKEKGRSYHFIKSYNYKN